jgi:hypothetical protein
MYFEIQSKLNFKKSIMKQFTINRNMAIAIGSLLAFPTAFFILISLLKYSFGISYLFDSTEPLLNRLGLKNSFGWNINLFILFGPLIAMLLNLFAVLKMEWHNEKQKIEIKLSIEKHWWNMVLVILSGILLAALFIYALGENCKC